MPGLPADVATPLVPADCHLAMHPTAAPYCLGHHGVGLAHCHEEAIPLLNPVGQVGTVIGHLQHQPAAVMAVRGAGAAEL